MMRVAAIATFIASILGLSFPPCATGGPLFYIESPRADAVAAVPGIEVWERFWVDGGEVDIVSLPEGGVDILPSLGAGYGEIALTAGEELFIITAPQGISSSHAAACGTVILGGRHVALLTAGRASADALAGLGVQLQAVMPPPGKRLPGAAYPGGVTVNRGRTLAWDAGIQQVIDEVTQSDVWDLLGNLGGENSVTIGGSPYTIQTRNSYQATPIENATQYCYEYFQDLGLSAGYHDYSWNGYSWRNVVAEKPGHTNPDDIYIICGHLDDMPSGATAPGADDNASGSIAVLLAANVLGDRYFENTIRFVLFTGEEQGLIGSDYYVQDLVSAGDNVLGALNFDMIAYDGNADGLIEVHCGSLAASETLGDLLISTVSDYSLALSAEKLTVGSVTASDHARFWNAGIPALLGIEDTWVGATSDFNPYYHSVSDTRANCDLSYTTDYVKAAVGTIARLGVMLDITPTPTPMPTVTPTPTATPDLPGEWINFQTAGPPRAPGFSKDDGSPYGTHGGWGWL